MDGATEFHEVVTGAEDDQQAGGLGLGFLFAGDLSAVLAAVQQRGQFVSGHGSLLGGWVGLPGCFRLLPVDCLGRLVSPRRRQLSRLEGVTPQCPAPAMWLPH